MHHSKKLDRFVAKHGVLAYAEEPISERNRKALVIRINFPLLFTLHFKGPRLNRISRSDSGIEKAVSALHEELSLKSPTSLPLLRNLIYEMSSFTEY